MKNRLLLFWLVHLLVLVTVTSGCGNAQSNLNAISMPPPNATAARNATPSPKRASQMGGSHSLANSPPVRAAKFCVNDDSSPTFGERSARL